MPSLSPLTVVSKKNVTMLGNSKSDRKVLQDKFISMFLRIQESSDYQPNITEESTNLYKRSDHKVFVEVLFKVMIVPFSNPTSEYNSRVIKFYHSLLTVLDGALRGEESEFGQEILTGIRTRTIRLFLKYHSDKNPLVRARLVETIQHILRSVMLVSGRLDCKLKNNLKNALFHRLVDKSPEVRSEAVQALAHLQDLSGRNPCYVTERLLHHLKFDPNTGVRKTVAQSMTFFTGDKDSLLGIIRDKQEVVRLAGFAALEKVPISRLDSKDLHFLICGGKQDKSGPIRRATDALIWGWFKQSSYFVIDFLRYFILDRQRQAAELALDTLFPGTEHSTYEKVDWKSFSDKIIPMDGLSDESAFFWRYLVEKFAESDYSLQVMPEITKMYSYIIQFIDMAKNTSCDEFILCQLLMIALQIPVEEGGRYVLLDLLRALAAYRFLQPKHVQFVVRIYQQAQVSNSDTEFLKLVKEIMNGARSACKSSGIVSPLEVEKDKTALTSEAIILLKRKMGQLVHERYEMVLQMEDAKEEGDLQRIRDLDAAIQSREKLMCLYRQKLGLNPNSRGSERDKNQVIVDEDVDESDEYPDSALELGFCAVLTYLRAKGKASGKLLKFMELYGEAALNSKSEIVRSRFLEMATLIGFSFENVAMSTMVSCITNLCYGSPVVKQHLSGCIFDLLVHYGLEFFAGDPITNTIQKIPMLKELVVEFNILTPLKTVLVYLLNISEIEMRKKTIVGVIKLLLRGRIKYESAISTLLILWNMPVHASSRIYADISCWLSNYTRLGLVEANLVVDCFTHCLKRMINCKKDAPMKGANTDKFVEFITANTDQRYICDLENSRTVHLRIAMNILNEMVSLREHGTGLSQYARAMKSLNLNGLRANEDRRLRRRIEKIKEFCHIKGVRNSLDAFSRYLDSFDHSGEPECSGDSASEASDNGEEASEEESNSNSKIEETFESLTPKIANLQLAEAETSNDNEIENLFENERLLDNPGGEETRCESADMFGDDC